LDLLQRSDRRGEKKTLSRLAMRLCFISLIGIHVSALGATPESPPCPADLNQRFKEQSSAVLPWPQDTLGQQWAARPKYFIIVGVTKISTDASKAEDFATVDVANVASVLCDLGYAPVPSAPYGAQLSGSKATINNLTAAFSQTNQIGSNNPLLILYYSGHGLPTSAGDDLYLPLFEATALTINQSQSLKSLLTKLRTNYEGDLIVILDACFSGTASVGKLLTGVDEFKRTAILTSSSADEYSYPIKIGPTKESAFTHYFLEALRSGGDVHDGLTLLGDAHANLVVKLYDLYSNPATSTGEKLPGPMTPGISEAGSSRLVAYSRDRIENPKTTRRFRELLNAKIVSAFNLDTPGGQVPSEIQVFSGQTRVATYDVVIDAAGRRSLVPKEVAPDGTVIDATKFFAIGVVGGGEGQLPTSVESQWITKSFEIHGLSVGPTKRLVLKQKDLNYQVDVPWLKVPIS
jgi:hypothetical protein